jgi:hypothetical protein
VTSNCCKLFNHLYYPTHPPICIILSPPTLSSVLSSYPYSVLSPPTLPSVLSSYPYSVLSPTHPTIRISSYPHPVLSPTHSANRLIFYSVLSPTNPAIRIIFLSKLCIITHPPRHPYHFPFHPPICIILLPKFGRSLTLYALYPHFSITSHLSILPTRPFFTNARTLPFGAKTERTEQQMCNKPYI